MPDLRTMSVRELYAKAKAPDFSWEEEDCLAELERRCAPPPDVDEAADAITKIVFERYDRGEGKTGGEPFRIALQAELSSILAGPADANVHSGDGR